MNLTPAQRQEIIAIIGQTGANKRGIVTSYQASPPMVKAQIMPAPPESEGPPPETGWIPYKSFATGLNGNGWAVVAPPQAGQQVLLICEEADGENYVAWGGYYSDVDPAPQGAQSGEILFAHQSGARLHLNVDGSITVNTAKLSIAGPNGDNTQISITGSLTVSEEATIAGKAFTPHTHPYTPGNGSPTQTGTAEN